MKQKRSKILYILDYLREKTDDNHGVTMADIQAMLRTHGIDADRKTIYDDFSLLREYGLEIEANKGGGTCTYNLLTRTFELSELKVLVDAVQVAKFISEKKTDELIRKLETLTSEYQAKELQHQVFISGRVKTATENVYYAVDTIHTAISRNSQITFKYFNWSIRGEKVYHQGGKTYTASPWALVWEDENYYLIAYHEGILKYFRVDKMQNINPVSPSAREGRSLFEASDYKHLGTSTFRMFHGDPMKVTLDFDESAAGIIIDQFGREHMFSPAEEGRFHVTVPVSFSDQFVSWLLALGGKVKLIAPKEALEKVREFLRDRTELYR